MKLFYVCLLRGCIVYVFSIHFQKHGCSVLLWKIDFFRFFCVFFMDQSGFSSWTRKKGQNLMRKQGGKDIIGLCILGHLTQDSILKRWNHCSVSWNNTKISWFLIWKIFQICKSIAQVGKTFHIFTGIDWDIIMRPKLHGCALRHALRRGGGAPRLWIRLFIFIVRSGEKWKKEHRDL